MNRSPTLAVSIATHNRRSDLAVTLEGLIRLLVHDRARGSIISRDRIRLVRKPEPDFIALKDS